MKKTITLIIMLGMLGVEAFCQLVPPSFTDLDGIGYDKPTNTLTKLIGDGWRNNSAFSENELASGSSGIIEYDIENPNDVKAFGVSSNPVDGLGLATIEYGFYVSKSDLFILVGGLVKVSLGKVGGGETLKIDIRNNSIFFFLGRSRVFSTNFTLADYHIAAVINNQGGTFAGITTDIPMPPPPPPPLQSTQYSQLTILPTSFVKRVSDEFCFSFNYRKIGDSDQIMFAVYNLKHIDKSINASIPDLSLNNGINQYCMDVGGISEGIYTLEVTLPNGDKRYSKFENGVGTIDQSNSGPK